MERIKVNEDLLERYIGRHRRRRGVRSTSERVDHRVRRPVGNQEVNKLLTNRPRCSQTVKEIQMHVKNVNPPCITSRSTIQTQHPYHLHDSRTLTTSFRSNVRRHRLPSLCPSTSLQTCKPKPRSTGADQLKLLEDGGVFSSLKTQPLALSHIHESQITNSHE